MNTSVSSSPTNAEHKKNFDNAPLVEVTRTFSSPVSRLWDAWSKEEQVQQWWGPEGFSSANAKIDFRVGGKYLFSMKSPTGQVNWSTGTYEKIIPQQLIVCSDQFADQNGQPITPKEAGMPGEWSDSEISFITIEFEEIGTDRTKMTLTHEGIPLSVHDDCVAGWDTTIDKLQKLVEVN